ncbi:MAG: hypothetical protein JWN48_4427 [Myxococcaceae bacterium]|nr:hypothetical protein [Myxococcaceae bacterium]
MALGAEKHSVGWYAGALVFWLLSTWLATVGLSSIIPQIFWPAGDVHSSATSCGPALRELRTELLTRMSHSIASPSTETRHEDLLAWFEDWDKRLFVAKPACRDDERPAWRELTRLRHGMQGLIERFEREEAPHNQRLDQLLASPAEARAHPLEDHTP